MRHHRISLDDNEHERVSHASRHSAHNSSHLHRVQLADHHPRHDQEAHRAGDHESEHASDWNPRVKRHNPLGIAKRFVVEVKPKCDHRHAAADAGDERERSSAALPERHAGEDCEQESQRAEHDCARELVDLGARVLEDLHRVEGNRVNA